MARLCLDHSTSVQLKETSHSILYITEIQQKIALDRQRSPAILECVFFAGTREIQLGQLSAVILCSMRIPLCKTSRWLPSARGLNHQ